MAAEPGSNYGVSGIIDLVPGTGEPPAVRNPPQIQAMVLGFALALAADVVEITGPGSAHAKRYYGSNVGGPGTAEATVQSVQRPFPVTMRNLQGTITHAADTNASISMPVLIQTLTCTKNVKQADSWRVTIAWVKNGVETVNGWGSAATYNQPTLTTQEIFSGTQKITDPQALTSSYLVKYIIPIAGSDDTAGNAAVDTWLAAAAGSPPRTGLKPVNATLLRLDDAAGLLIAQWGLKDSKDEWVLAHTKVALDPQSIKDDVTSAAVFTTNSPPSDPSAPTGLDGQALKLVMKVDETLTPGASGKTGRTWMFGRNDSKDELERSLRHGNLIEVDPNGIESHARLTRVATSQPSTPSAPAAGLTIDSISSRNVTDQLGMFSFNYGTMNSIDRRQLKEIITDNAPIPLESGHRLPKVNATASTPSGEKLIRTITRDIDTTNVVIEVETGLRDSNDKIIFDGTEISIGTTVGDSYWRKTDITACLAGDDLVTVANAIVSGLPTASPSPQSYPFKNLRARRWHDTAIVWTALYQFPPVGHVDNGAKILIVNNIGAIKTNSWLGFTAGTPSLYVARSQTRGTGRYRTKLGQYASMGAGGPLKITQRLNGSAPPNWTPALLKTNSTTFLNCFPAGSVMFLSATEEVVVTGTTSTYDMTYNFNVSITQNWVGFPTIVGIPVGGIIEGTINPNGGTLGDWAGSGGPTTWTWNFGGQTVKAILPATDPFTFTTWTF